MASVGGFSSFVTLRDGIRLHVETLGEGDPILLVHGFTGSVRAWGVDILSHLARNNRVIAIDLLGHGASDTPSDPRRHALPEVVEDLISLLDSLEIERPAWIGYSMGGRVALAAAIERPERVGSLVLESSSPGLESKAERADRRSSDAALAERIVRGGIEDFVDYWSELPLFASQKRLPVKTREAIRERRLRSSPEGLAGCLAGLGTGSQPSYWDRLHEIRVRTLLISGGEDSKFTSIAVRMAQLVPGASTCVVAKTGHTVHIERPNEWLRAVGEHLFPPADAIKK